LRQRIRFLPEQIRYRINSFLIQTLSPNQAGVYKAILTGDRSGLSPEISEAFKSSGATHLLAISGIHIGLLALLSTFLFNLLLRRSEALLLRVSALKLAAVLSLLPLTAYALIAGLGPPVIRSLIMAGVFIAALLCNRQCSIANSIAIAALILFVYDPGMLNTASFQLSFGAVMVIALFAPLLKRLAQPKPPEKPQEALSTPNPAKADAVLYDSNQTTAPPDKPLFSRLSHDVSGIWSKLRRWALLSLLISIIASVGTAPILLTHFNRISLLSPITTLLIEPLLCLWSLVLGLFASLLLPFPQISALIFQAGAVGIDLAIAITSALAALPMASIWRPAPPITQSVSWYILLIILATWRSAQFSKLKRFGLAVGLIGLASPAFNFFLPNSTNHLKIAVLDVGQGSAIVFHLPDGQTFLLDGGQKTSGKSTQFNIGQQVIAPYLWLNRITKLAGLIISHPDADHYNGLPFIVEEFRPAQVWVNSFDSTNDGDGFDMFRLLLERARDLGIPVSIPEPGENLLTDTRARLAVISEHGNSQASGKSISHNDDSLVLRLDYGRQAFLFPSDIEAAGETAVINQASAQINTDVLIAPHHGSKTSSSPAFLKAVSPAFIVVSAGKSSAGMFPSPDNLAAYNKIGSKVYLTAESGSVFFTTDGTALSVTTFRQPTPQ
jgi:competence protein ComEC